ncbi:hypothetical protein PD280_07430 [Virgibacillus salarius]|uniref:hypothetical protein n=1 Tax=Virgibacillus salarius TaxID=447199 RepID=UPI002492CA9E|nr:hypothetical protein [Virgibacillus salarius]WBX81523.1 hypothetical protein PD280_07430 [Virgibacillus salarius]
MDKILSIRSNKQISSLFAEIQNYQQSTNRTEIVNRALEKAIDNKVDWRAISLLKIKENPVESVQPNSMQIRVEYSKYNVVVEEIKEIFDLVRVKAPYLIKLLLSFYLSELRKKDRVILTDVEKMVNWGVDCLVFKKEFDYSEYEGKKNLYELSRRYLEECNPTMKKNIHEQVNTKIKSYSDFFNRNKYFPKPRSDFGSCNIVFVSKVLAGLFLMMSEIWDFDIEEILVYLETEVNNLCS